MLENNIPDHLKADCALLFQAVREAGAIGQALAKQAVKRWSKPDGSTVTEADITIDSFLNERLMAARPDYGWLSEETPDTPDRLTKQRLWIVDPIDGTNSFVNGTQGWCIGAALTENGKPILAALFQPVPNLFYAAAVGCGTFCNDDAAHPYDGGGFAGARLLGTGRALKILPGISAEPSPQIPLLLRLAHVASGKADIALSLGMRNDWDLAAGDLLVREAGGIVTQSDGLPMVYNQPLAKQNGLLAAGKNRHRAVLAQLEKNL
ncbi:MAG: 3'(2'),5'-bisphosphate nucleotidase CysQ [Alphaproteobacteria bacterium]|nr:3'(2'),5'-bisphosphate nucleotidase CysQ [Alphaproteobacteria bacterium]